MSEKTCNGCESKEREPSIAMEVVNHAKVKEKRWFIMAMVELGMIFAIFLSIIYFLLTTEITYTDVDQKKEVSAFEQIRLFKRRIPELYCCVSFFG